MNRMSELLIIKYIQLWYEIRLKIVSYCFQPDKIICIFGIGIVSLILMRFTAKQLYECFRK